MFNKLKKHFAAHKNPYTAGFVAVILVAGFFVLKSLGVPEMANQLTGNIAKSTPTTQQPGTKGLLGGKPAPSTSGQTKPTIYSITSDKGINVVYLKVGNTIKFTATIGKNTAGWNGTQQLDILGANTEALFCNPTTYTATQAFRECTATQNAGNSSDSQMAVYALSNTTAPLSNIITVKVLQPSTTSTAPANQISARATNITSNSVTLFTKYQLQPGELYNSTCSPYEGVIVETGKSTTLPISFLVGSLQSDMTYDCNIRIYSSDGSQIRMSNTMRFNTLSPNTTTGIPSLSVTRARTPGSGSFVKGQANVSALGVALTATNAEVTVDRMTIRLYGNSAQSPWANPLGDLAANTMVSSVALYVGNDILGGPVSLSLDASGTHTALFQNLGYKVAPGAAKIITVKVKLLNSMTTTTYLAADLNPSLDIVAWDSMGNEVKPVGLSLNSGLAHNPELTILKSGTLGIFSENNPLSQNVAAGTIKQLVSRYRFTATGEDIKVNKLTIINDLEGVFDTPTNTNAAVKGVRIQYTDINGASQTRPISEFPASLSEGSATIALGPVDFDPLNPLNQTFYIQANKSVYLEVYADVSSEGLAGEPISGKTFRLGLKDTTNNVGDSFDAEGIFSGEAYRNPKIEDGRINYVVPTMTVIESQATVTKLPSNAVWEDANPLLSFSVAANYGDVTVTQMKFAVEGPVQPSEYKLYKDNAVLMASSVPEFDLTNNPVFITKDNSSSFEIKGTVSVYLEPGAKLTTSLTAGGLTTTSAVHGLPLGYTVTR